jgi:hypothetical protein
VTIRGSRASAAGCARLDELPQLLNVLRGEMSLVGPRSEAEAFVRLYDPAQRKVLELAPGITDPASLAYIDESSFLARADDPMAAYRTDAALAELQLDQAVEQRRLGSWFAPADRRAIGDCGDAGRSARPCSPNSSKARMRARAELASLAAEGREVQ